MGGYSVTGEIDIPEKTNDKRRETIILVIQFPIDTLAYSCAMSTNIEVTTRFKCIIEILDEQNKHDIYR